MRLLLGGSRIFFDVEGAKLRPQGRRMREVPTLLLLHGGPGFDHSTFKPVMAPLADAVQLVYLDHRGQGRSDPVPRSEWRLERWSDDVKDFCDALSIERPIVMGDSFGGMVAMSYAIRYPGEPAGLILSSSPARLRLDRMLPVFERLGGNEAREAARAFWENPCAELASEYMRRCLPLYTRTRSFSDAATMRRALTNTELMFHFLSGEMQNFDLLPALHSIRCPTLILAGEDDPVCTLADAEDIANAIPSPLVRLERFANAGHGVFRDAPARALAVIREFIAGIASRDGSQHASRVAEDG